MKHSGLIFLAICCIFTAACYANHKATPPSVSFEPTNSHLSVRDALNEENEETKETDAPNTPLEKPSLPPAKAEMTAAKTVHKKEKAPEEVTIFLPDAGTDLNAQPDTPQQIQQAETLIKQARQSQTLQFPPEDQVSFEKEDLIPLTERLLNPLAYEPLSTDDTQAPWSGEELKYGIYYSFIRAGTAYIKNRGLTTVNGRKAYLLQTTAFSAAVIDAFFKVRDINYSWLDAENFYSLGYLQSVREGGYKRDEWLIFDYPKNLFYGEIQKKESPRIISGPLSMQVLDMLSSLYFVRAQRLEPGRDIIFDIINRERQYPLIVKVLGKETVKTEAGKFDCIIVEPQFRGEGIFVSKGKSLKVWLTDDQYKMPVKMKTEVFIGSVSAELLEYKRN